MRYDQLEHAISAACDVSGDTELLILRITGDSRKFSRRASES
jgi:hypothetical protein